MTDFDEVLRRLHGHADRARAVAAAQRGADDPFIAGLRELGMGAWRRLEVDGVVSEAGRRVPDRAVPPVPGRPDGLRETVVAGPGFGPELTGRKK